MANYAPTSFTKYLDMQAMRAGKPVLATSLDEIISDQTMTLIKRSIVISDFFWRYRTQSESFVEVARYHLDGTDYCDSATRAAAWTGEEYVFCKCDASTEGEFKIETTVGSDSVTTAFTNTTWAWIPTLGTTHSSDETEETLVLSVQRTSGSGYVWIGGILVVV